MPAAPNDPLYITVREYVALTGLPEYTVRVELRLNRIPHRRVGHRGLIKILRAPALRAAGLIDDDVTQ
jgi:hypothetical protein